MLTPKKSLGKFRFCVLAGAEGVQLTGDKIVGRFREKLVEFCGPRKGRLIEDFLNWPHDNASILRFTRKYGPLQAESAAAKDFEFFPEGWQLDQKHFQWLWRTANRFPDWEPKGGTLAFRNGWLTYTASSLYMFLYMDLVTCEAKRLRVCKRPDCPTPHFIAGHLKQCFCSDKCAEWGQRQWKQKWWKEHGDTWRAQRHEQKGKRDGTRKTR
jgi:hypothetical protein